MKKPILINDSFQNFKRYNIPRAQLVICDIPYNLGVNAYGSRSDWYVDGDNKKGESEKAGKSFFYSDGYFNIAEYFHFCHKLLKKDPTKGKGGAACMIVFCAWQQIELVRKYGEKHGFKHMQLLVFVKPSSSNVLKANMKIVDAAEYALVLYRDRLPKFRNNGQMVKNWFNWQTDGKRIKKIHETQKPVIMLKRLIEIYTDPGDVVIDPCAGSASTLRAAYELGREAYGFEISKEFCKRAQESMLAPDALDQVTVFTYQQEKHEQMTLEQFATGG